MFQKPLTQTSQYTFTQQHYMNRLRQNVDIENSGSMRFSQKGQQNDDNSTSLNKMKAKKDKDDAAVGAGNTLDTKKRVKSKKLNELIALQKEKNRMKESMRSVLKRDTEKGRGKSPGGLNTQRDMSDR